MILYVFGEKWRTKMVLERLFTTYGLCGLCVLLMTPAIGLALYALYWAFKEE